MQNTLWRQGAPGGRYFMEFSETERLLGDFRENVRKVAIFAESRGISRFGRNFTNLSDPGTSKHLKRLVQNTLLRQGRKRGGSS